MFCTESEGWEGEEVAGWGGRVLSAPASAPSESTRWWSWEALGAPSALLGPCSPSPQARLSLSLCLPPSWARTMMQAWALW